MTMQTVPSPGEPTGPPRRATLKDVAFHAGVSVPAVSKVLRNAYGVSPAMRRKVEEAIAELGYRPLASARGTRGGHTFTIGVLVSDIKNPFFGFLIDGISEQTATSGYGLFVGPGGVDSASQSRMINGMLDHRMDGLILIAPSGEEPDLIAAAKQIPTIIIGRHGSSDAYDSVAGDDMRGAQLVVEHLVGLGHTRIAHLSHTGGSDPDHRRPESVRARGYEAAMQDHGLEENIDIIRSTWSQEGGQTAAAELCERRRLPSAVFAGADIAALGVLSKLWNSGVEVPADISIVGYDNVPASQLPPISLTSVDQSGTEMGRRAAELLLQRVNGRTASTHELFEPALIARRTTARVKS